MESGASVNTEVLLEDLGGCGLFQVLLVFFLCLPRIPIYFNVIFMSFGGINPGWRCLDNTTFGDHDNNSGNDTTADANTSQAYIASCEGFDSCQNIDFEPSVSSIVTEWGLICSKTHISSLMITLQMVGLFVGEMVVGLIGDRFGRHLPFHVSTMVLCVLNLVTIFSNSWEMYITLIVLCGFFNSFILLSGVLQAEMVVSLWRIRVSSLPIWSTGIAIFSILAMLTKDWKILALITSVTTGVAVFPMFWVPESLRWLYFNGKYKKARKVVQKIAKYNRVNMPEERLPDFKAETNTKEKKVTSSTFLDLFKKGYRIPTFIIMVVFSSINLIYFGLSFGVSKLPGNMFVNMIILSVCEFPGNAITVLAGNSFGRKKTTVVGYIVLSACLFGVVVMDRFTESKTREIGMIVLVIICKIMLIAIYYAILTGTQEFYPTVVRSTVTCFADQMARIGSFFAPYVVPTEPETLYICYMVMGVVALVCGLLAILFPETKGKDLNDTWDNPNVKDDVEKPPEKDDLL